MSLDFEFSPIDVRLEGHPKAFEAGPEAMGLWLWGKLHSKGQRTSGHLARSAVLAAWGGKRNIVLAKRLVDAGLWIPRDDGSWDIFNEEKKGPGNGPKKSTDRVRRHRVLKRGETPPSVSPSVSETPLHETCASPSVSLSSDPVPDPDLPDRSSMPQDRAFETGTAAAVEAMHAFESAVSAATSRPFALARAPFHASDLCVLLNAHGPPGVRAALGWLGPTVKHWTEAAEAKYAAGWAPSKLLAWLNADRPDKRDGAREAPSQRESKGVVYAEYRPSDEPAPAPDIAREGADRLAKLFG